MDFEWARKLDREGCNEGRGWAGVNCESSIPSTSLLGVEYCLERVRHKIVSTWHKGTQQECEEELTACRKELTTFNEGDWRIVRIERHLVTPNAQAHRQEEAG